MGGKRAGGRARRLVDGVRSTEWRLEVSNGAPSAGRSVRLVDGRRISGRVAARHIHRAMGADRGDARARPALARRPVDHPEAGDAMRSERHAVSATRNRGQGLLAVVVLVVVVGGGLALQRGLGPRLPGRGCCAGDGAFRCVVLPTRGRSQGMAGHALPRESGSRDPVTARVTSLVCKEGQLRRRVSRCLAARNGRRNGSRRRPGGIDLRRVFRWMAGRRLGSLKEEVVRSASERSRARPRPRAPGSRPIVGPSRGRTPTSSS